MKATVSLFYEGHAGFAKIPVLRLEMGELLDTYHFLGLELAQSCILFQKIVLSNKYNIKLCELYLRFLNNFRNREQARYTCGQYFLS